MCQIEFINFYFDRAFSVHRFFFHVRHIKSQKMELITSTTTTMMTTHQNEIQAHIFIDVDVFAIE